MINRGQIIFITGASGFIGSSLVSLLIRQNYSLKILVRKPVKVNLLSDSIEYIYSDIRNFDKLRQTLNGVDAVIHLAACKADEPESYNVNVGGVESLIKECKTNGVKKIINVSTQAALFNKRGIYGETKKQADKLLEESNLDVVTLYPSLIYGHDKKGVFAKLVKQILDLPIIPILGNGKNFFQPIYVEDIAKIILACLQKDILKKTYEVGSAAVFTFDQLIDKIQNHLDVSKKKVHIPWSLGYYTIILMNFLSLFPPITVSNVLGLSSQNIRAFDIQPMLTDLGITPISFEEGLKIISQI